MTDTHEFDKIYCFVKCAKELYEFINKIIDDYISNGYPCNMTNTVCTQCKYDYILCLINKQTDLSCDEYNKLSYVLGEVCIKLHKYSEAKNYYSICVNNNYSDSLRRLGIYYENHEPNFELMEKYYLQSININNDILSAYHLSSYYYRNNSFDLAKKYVIHGCNIYKFNNEDVMDVMLELLLHRSSLINIYFETNNNDVKQYLYNRKSVKDFINVAVDEICELCFMEMKCVVRNNMFVCGICF